MESGSPTGRFDVSGKRVLITGAAGGIGMTLARGFWEAGATVVPVYRGTNLKWNPGSNGTDERWHPVCCDLGDTSAIESLCEESLRVCGGCVDVLINNAAVCPAATGNAYDERLRDSVFSISFHAPYALCGRLAPVMADNGGGSIINVTSMNAERAWPGNPAYVTAKAALRLLTKSLARDFGGKGVRANNLCPGYFATNMTKTSYSDPQANEARRSRTMLGRWGQPDDLLGPALFLASDASRYVTGIDLHVDGGWSAMGM